MTVATALTVYGIETPRYQEAPFGQSCYVATALTVYGIETLICSSTNIPTTDTLQQHLPFTVLKRFKAVPQFINPEELQQHLPFTVLKHNCFVGIN